MEFTFDDEKNQLLIDTRGVSFNDVIDAIVTGNLLETFQNPNQSKYPGQLILVVRINDYPHCVPAIMDGQSLILKTVYPCRRFRYLMEDKKHD